MLEVQKIDLTNKLGRKTNEKINTYRRDRFFALTTMTGMALADPSGATAGSQTGSTGQVMTYISNVVGEVNQDIQIEVSFNQPGTKALLQAAKGDADIHLIVPFIASLLKGGKAMYKNIPNHDELFGEIRAMTMYPGGTFQLIVWEKSGIKSLKICVERMFSWSPWLSGLSYDARFD